MGKFLGKATTVLGIAGIAVAVVYWFDLDDAFIRKAEPLLRKVAAIKKASAQAAAAAQESASAADADSPPATVDQAAG